MILNKKKSSEAEVERPEIEYPCTWVYKVIGEDCTLLKDVITTTCAPIDVSITHSHMSSKGKYHSLNAELIVPNEEIRLGIYETLKSALAVKIVL
ncbi:MAG: putative lipoic acid-binding regulatory protein [Desulforhopalus sp.]|jgi:putative lipoic acid-binding regulatory protein